MSRDETRTKLELDRIIFIGRTFEEYLDMFALTEQFLQGKTILDCPAGACSFTAIGQTLGLNVTACDIAYDHPEDDLNQKGTNDIDHAMHHMAKAKNNYHWDYFGDIDTLKQYRLSALHHCTKDMQTSKHRYVSAVLPLLPFEDKAFDVVLSAHFLFMYGDRLDYRFHLETLNELLRVANQEVRIFPLVDLEGHRYVYLNKIMSDLRIAGYQVEEVSVPYTFQRNASSMLKIEKEPKQI